MRYIIGDIHGCYDEFNALLKKIRFSNEDELWVLGDAVDRGPEPVKVLRKIMESPNMHYIIGNHDYFMCSIFSALLEKHKELKSDDALTLEELDVLLDWAKEGGAPTIKQFLACPIEEQIELMDFLANSPAFTILEHEEKSLVLTHAGIENYQEGKELSEYPKKAFLHKRADYSKPLFADANTILVTGHTSTPLIRPDGSFLIYKENGHIALDCGCVFGGKLAAYCIETGEAFYVDRKFHISSIFHSPNISQSV